MTQRVLVIVVALLGALLPVAAEEPTVTLADAMLVEAAGATFMGVHLEEEVEHPDGGARVVQVVGDSPAEAAGIEDGDIVVQFDDHVIRGPLALTQRIHAREPGDVVHVVVIRDGKERKTLEVALGQRESSVRFFGLPIDPDDETVTGDTGWNAEQWGEWQERFTEQMERLGERYADPEIWSRGYGIAPRIHHGLFGGRPKLGVQLVEATPELRVHLGSDENLGVLVSKVLAGTPAEHAGIAVGDLIVGVADEPIADSADLIRALEDRSGESFDVELIRDGELRTITVTIPAPEIDTPTGPRA